MVWGEIEDYGALPDALVRQVIRRVLERVGLEAALGLYLTHRQWRLRKGLPFLSPEEVGILVSRKEKTDGYYEENGGGVPKGAFSLRARKRGAGPAGGGTPLGPASCLEEESEDGGKKT